MIYGNREISKAIRDLLHSVFTDVEITPFEPSTETTDEHYPRATYFVQLIGVNNTKKDYNSYTVQRDEIYNKKIHQDTPNYMTFLIQVDFWSRRMSGIDYLIENWLSVVDACRPTLEIQGYDGTKIVQYMYPRDLGRNADEQQRNGEKLYRRTFSYTVDVPVESPNKQSYSILNKITIRHVQFNKKN